MRQIGKTVRPSILIQFRQLLSNERAPGGLDRDRPGSGQRIVGMPNRVEVYPESHRSLPHGWHLLTRFKNAGADSPEQLVSDLHIDGNARSLYVKRV